MIGWKLAARQLANALSLVRVTRLASLFSYTPLLFLFLTCPKGESRCYSKTS